MRCIIYGFVGFWDENYVSRLLYVCDYGVVVYGLPKNVCAVPVYIHMFLPYVFVCVCECWKLPPHLFLWTTKTEQIIVSTFVICTCFSL